MTNNASWLEKKNLDQLRVIEIEEEVLGFLELLEEKTEKELEEEYDKE